MDKKSEEKQVIIKMKTDLHEESITFMLFNPFGFYVLSFAGGMPEIWDPDTFELPS